MPISLFSISEAISVAAMDRTLSTIRTWGAPAAGFLFAILWWVAESSRVTEDITRWDGLLPLVLVSAAICVSAWSALASLALTGTLLVAQLTHLAPPAGPTTWPMYIGAFVALAFMLWTGSRRTRVASLIASAVFTAAMDFIMISREYGSGVGWFRVRGVTAEAMVEVWWQCLAVLLVIGGGLAATGRLLALYGERRRLLGEKGRAETLLRGAEVELILEQERTRISRDLHDVLAHSLAVIIAQADGARYSRPDLPDESVRALVTIAGSARKAMTDAQRVIAATGDDGELAPHPGLGELKALADQSGLEVRRTDTGTPGVLSDMQQLAVYRVVQESFTNALKHGKATAVDLALSWIGEGLRFTVSSPLPLGTGALEQNSGRGVPGMKERAALAGGTLQAGRDGDRFVVEGFIPGLTEGGEAAASHLQALQRRLAIGAGAGSHD